MYSKRTCICIHGGPEQKASPERFDDSVLPDLPCWTPVSINKIAKLWECALLAVVIFAGKQWTISNSIGLFEKSPLLFYFSLPLVELCYKEFFHWIYTDIPPDCGLWMFPDLRDIRSKITESIKLTELKIFDSSTWG